MAETRSIFFLFTCIIGIYVPFILYNTLREELTKTKYKWKWSFLLVLIQCVGNIVTAYILRAMEGSNETTKAKTDKKTDETVPAGTPETDKPKKPVPTYLWFLVGLFNVASMVLSTSSLAYISYPTQIIARSCKPIPVMLFSVFIAREKYPFIKYVLVLSMCVGVSLFMLGSSDKSGSGSNTFEGYILLIGSLIADGIVNGLQQRMKIINKPKASTFMIGANVTGSLCLAIYILLNMNTEFYPAVEYIRAQPIVLYNVLACGIFMNIGTIFIFKVVAHYGTLVLSILTTTRKFFTLMISLYLYGHPMNSTMWYAIVLVFVSLAFDMILANIKMPKIEEYISKEVVIIESEKQLQGIIKENDRVVVDFGATWCYPCKMLKPTFHRLADKFNSNMAFCYVDVDKVGDATSAFKISSFPTILFIKKGKVQDKQVGFRGVGSLTHAIKDFSTK